MVIFVTLDHVLGKSCVLQLSAGPRVCSLTQTPGGGSRRASGVRRWCVLWGEKQLRTVAFLWGRGLQLRIKWPRKASLSSHWAYVFL